MGKKSIAVAVAAAALTFILLMVGAKFYEVYALQNPLSQELTNYNINKMQYIQQEKTVILFLENNSNLAGAVAEINKKFGKVNIELKDNAAPNLQNFYEQKKLYILQYIDAKQYGTLGDYLQKHAAEQGYKAEVTINNNNYLFLKISDSKTALYKIYLLEREV